jgi:DedD protein
MDSALKQRLLGAAVLIALAVIFVPMFLGNSPPKQDSVTQSLDIPPPPERKFATRTLPVDNTPPAATATAPVENVDADKPGADKIVTIDTKAPPTFEATDTAVSTAKPATPVPVKPTNGPTTTVPQPAAVPPPAVAAPAEGRFTVNMGIYADQSHVDALIAKVKKIGFASYAESAEYQGKQAQRVRAGPFSSRAAAEEARLKIKQSDPKLLGSVSESGSQQTADAPATAVAANRAGGWAVQVGAFKSETEANKVRDRLRNGSVAAFVDKSSGGDQTMWRVRAGPYADRSGADSARGSIKQKFQLDGMIVATP